MKRALLLLLAAPAAVAQQDYTATTAASGLQINGYADVGFAVAEGDGTSFAPGDTRIPADYGTDTFATAVNTRGDVASTDARGRFVNGFLPRSMNMGGQPSVLLNTFDLDLKYAAATAPILLFSRIQLLPRYGANGNETRVLVLTTFELDEYVFGALRAGASGFLLKGGEPADLLLAVRVVASGESLLAPSVACKPSTPRSHDSRKPFRTSRKLCCKPVPKPRRATAP